MLNKLNLSQKFKLITTSIIVILSIGFYLYFNFIVEKQFREGLLKKGTGLIQSSAFSLGAGLYFNDPKFLRNVLTGLENDPDIAFIYVTDRQNAMKFGYRYYQNSKRIKTFIDSKQSQIYSENDLILKQSIFFHDEYQGDIILGFSSQWVKEKVTEQTRNLILISIMLSLILILFASFISRAVTKPLKDASEQITHFSEKDDIRSLQLPVKGNDEIAQLAQALNHMSHKLEININELNRSKKYLETLFQVSPVPMIIADSMGKIEGANESASSFFGVESSVLIKMNIDQFLEDEEFNNIFNKILKRQQNIRSLVTTLKLTDGTQKVCEVNIAAHYDDQNFTKNIIFTIFDVTERIETQREILSNQTKLQRINQELTQKTAELERLSGWNKKNAQKLANLINISQLMMRATTSKAMLKRIAEEGRALLDAEECVIFLSEKKVNRIIPAVFSPVDIRERLASHFDDEKNFIGKTYKENDPFVFDSDELQAAEFDLLGLDSQTTFSLVSVPISEKNYRYGVIIAIKYNHNAFRVEDVHLLSTLANQAAILLDNIHLVNALKEKAQSLEDAYSELQKSQQQVIQLQKMESLGTLVGGIAHDFNNILGIIMPNTDLLKTDAKGNSTIKRRATIIEESAKRASDLTRQLLMFSRNQDIRVRRLSTNTLFTGITSMLKRTLGKEYEILLDIDPDVQDVEADESRITQIMINLALNARDAMPEGGKIFIRSYMACYKPGTDQNVKENTFVCISVSDTGSGIEPEYLDKIFDPFFTTKSVDKGTGLGLSVVYGIMQSHKGFIDVESKIGKGTTFYLYLPPVAKKIAIPEKLLGNTMPQGSENILVIDDEKLIRDSITDILQPLGYNVTNAEDGREALDIIQKKQKYFDLAIVDMSMPGMNGIETIAKIRKFDENIKILLSSGRLEEESEDFSKLKIDGILPKPYHLRELASTIRKILSNNVEAIVKAQ